METKEIPDLQEEPHQSDNSDDEMELEKEETLCLFCTYVSQSVHFGIEHLKTKHGVDFAYLKNKHKMDQYSFIKLINCIRYGDITMNELLTCTSVLWDDEKYLKPKEYEPWLTYDYEELLDLSDETSNDLEIIVQALQETVRHQALLLEQATEDMSKMRISFQRVIENDNTLEPVKNKNKCVADLSLKGDEGYFSSYDRFSIHHDMINDIVRTTAYRDALLRNKTFIYDKDILDVGCGTSILSVFASQAGAKSVVGVDNSDIIYNAMDIVKRNNIGNVNLVKGRLEDTELPQQKFDVIISEWMGYFLLFEGMLDSVIYARDNHLKEGGIVLPNRCTMSLIGYGSQDLYTKYVTFWSDVYGLDMSNIRREVLHEPLIEVVDGQYVLTDPIQIADLNLTTVDLNYSNFTFNFEVKCVKDGILNSFVGYFDTYFDLPEPIMFGTGPSDKPTHWKQTVFFIDQPQNIKTNDVIKGSVTCKRCRSSVRSLDIVIDVFGQKHYYYLD